jgi:hypothetical protein
MMSATPIQRRIEMLASHPITARMMPRMIISVLLRAGRVPA